MFANGKMKGKLDRYTNTCFQNGCAGKVNKPSLQLLRKYMKHPAVLSFFASSPHNLQRFFQLSVSSGVISNAHEIHFT